MRPPKPFNSLEGLDTVILLCIRPTQNKVKSDCVEFNELSFNPTIVKVKKKHGNVTKGGPNVKMMIN